MCALEFSVSGLNFDGVRSGHAAGLVESARFRCRLGGPCRRQSRAAGMGSNQWHADEEANRVKPGLVVEVARSKRLIAMSHGTVCELLALGHGTGRVSSERGSVESEMQFAVV